jgi:hypothetical protein
MDKRSCLLNNPTSDNIRITELDLSLPPGISNLFELNPELSYERIDYSMRHGTLRAAMENALCYLVPANAQMSYTNDVIIRGPQGAQVLPTRAKFAVDVDAETSIFDPINDVNLFGDEEVKPARQIEEEIKRAQDNIQNIEATVKEANLPEKPIENRYSPPVVKSAEAQQKIKNDLKMGYNTCEGKTAAGKRCTRRAKTGKKFCGLHNKPE